MEVTQTTEYLLGLFSSSSIIKYDINNSYQDERLGNLFHWKKQEMCTDLRKDDILLSGRPQEVRA